MNTREAGAAMAGASTDALAGFDSLEGVEERAGSRQVANTLAVGVALVSLSANPGCRAAAVGEEGGHPAARILHEELTSGRAPGVQYRFFSPDATLFRHDEGLADVDAGEPITQRTTYHGFSITKTFTAVAILKLAEQGVLELDGAAADYLPDFPYPGEITVRQLLTHSAGLPNPLPLRWVHLQQDNSTFDRDGFFDGVFARHRKPRGEPNVRFAYSNLGYVLLGRIVEAVSRLSYEEYVTDHILSPIGLGPSDLGFAVDNSRHARGHHRRNSLSYFALGFLIDKAAFMERSNGAWAAFRPYYVNGTAYGGIIGTADGFVRYGQALLDPRSGLLSPESSRALFSENILDSGKASGMALSWFKGELDGHTHYSHAGGGGGYYAEIRVYPELRRGSVILFNRSGMSDARFLDRVDRHLIEAPGGSPSTPHGSAR